QDQNPVRTAVEKDREALAGHMSDLRRAREGLNVAAQWVSQDCVRRDDPLQEIREARVLRPSIDQQADLHRPEAGTAAGRAPLSRYSESVNFPCPHASFNEGSRESTGSISVSAPGR